MKKLTIILTVISTLVLCVGLAAGSYWGFKLAMNLLAALEPQAAAITIIAVAGFICAVQICRSRARIGQKEASAFTHLEKTHLYEKILLLWNAKLKSTAAAMDPAVEDELHQLMQLLTLRGNPKVIKAYIGLHASETSVGLHSPDIPPRLSTLQMEMRKDLGLSMQNLKPEDLLQLLVADVQVAPEPGKASQPRDIQPRVSLAANA
jgi:hypothetical protein